MCQIGFKEVYFKHVQKKLIVIGKNMHLTIQVKLN